MKNQKNEDAIFLPIMSQEDEDKMYAADYPTELPILPLRNNVLYPGVVIPISVSRPSSLKLIEEVMKKDKIVGVLAQINPDDDEPDHKDLYDVGTVAKILQLVKGPDGNTFVIIQGRRRFTKKSMVSDKPYLKCKVELMDERKVDHNLKITSKLFAGIKEMSVEIVMSNPNLPQEAINALQSIQSVRLLLNFVASNLHVGVAEKQVILMDDDYRSKAMRVLKRLNTESQEIILENDIRSKVREGMDKQQREYYLQQQMRAIKEELGEASFDDDLEELHARADKMKWSDKEKNLFIKESSKLSRINPQSAEYSVQYNYLNFMLDLPWGNKSQESLDLLKAKEILDRDHFGMEKVKERILEYLAVLKLKKNMKGPILCFYGPPGVGKTSLGKSIAEAIGRKYIRMSLGGVHDESEIRGHRKTYIGAMPGRILQNIKKIGSSNPVFVLDEIDKVGSSRNGDPSSALLEVLDPEQNSQFYDNYLETEYDLSDVMFVATSNSLTPISGPLRDRMEIIEVTGYTIEEKIEIAKRHLIPKQLDAHGVKKTQLDISETVIEKMIEEYTNESGVRKLDQVIAKLVRSRAREIAMKEKFGKEVKLVQLQSYLGAGRPRTKYDHNKVAGVVTGLAWTSVGGDILFIESSLTKGKGKLTLTGNLGEVMKESAVIALEYLKAKSKWFSLDQELFDRYNVHVHVPEGATPKDGPSAGITMLTSLASLFTQRKVKNNIAMTGEITLRGDVLPVGGIKEKILAAKRAGISEIILCDKNKSDIDEIKAEYVKGLKFHFVKTMKEVIDLALTDEQVEDPVILN